MEARQSPSLNSHGSGHFSTGRRWVFIFEFTLQRGYLKTPLAYKPREWQNRGPKMRDFIGFSFNAGT